MAVTASIHELPEGEDPSEMYIPRAPIGGELEGLARCYKLSSPVDLDGDGIPDEYVIVRLLYRRENMHAEIAIFPCDSTGSARGPSLMRRMGSFPLVPDPQGNDDAIEFAIAVAFKFYDITLGASNGD